MRAWRFSTASPSASGRGLEDAAQLLDRPLLERDAERPATCSASERVPALLKRVGIEIAVTRDGPSASAARAATSAESMPPERPSTTRAKPFFST